MGQCSSALKEDLKQELWGAPSDAWSLAGRGDVKGLKKWLDGGGDPNGLEPHLRCRELPLHPAARCGQIESMRVLIDAGSFVDVAAVCGTPLHTAARHGRIKAAQLLLSCDADALALRGGKTPAAIAEKAGHLELARLLRQAAQEQVQNPVVAEERRQRRLREDAVVKAKGKRIAAKRKDEVVLQLA